MLLHGISAREKSPEQLARVSLGHRMSCPEIEGMSLMPQRILAESLVQIRYQLCLPRATPLLDQPLVVPLGQEPSHEVVPGLEARRRLGVSPLLQGLQRPLKPLLDVASEPPFFIAIAEAPERENALDLFAFVPLPSDQVPKISSC